MSIASFDSGLMKKQSDRLCHSNDLYFLYFPGKKSYGKFSFGTVQAIKGVIMAIKTVALRI